MQGGCREYVGFLTLFILWWIVLSQLLLQACFICSCCVWSVPGNLESEPTLSCVPPVYPLIPKPLTESSRMLLSSEIPHCLEPTLKPKPNPQTSRTEPESCGKQELNQFGLAALSVRFIKGVFGDYVSYSLNSLKSVA